MFSPENPEIMAIAAHSENRVIGKNGTIPWHVKGDLKFWRDMSRGKPVIMGRKTFLDMPPGFRRRPHIIVITRDPDFEYDGVTVVHSLEDALDAARQICKTEKIDKIVIGGGGEIYAQALHCLDSIYQTVIHCTVKDGDAFFPKINFDDWQLDGAPQEFAPEEGDSAGYTINHYRRQDKAGADLITECSSPPCYGG